MKRPLHGDGASKNPTGSRRKIRRLVDNRSADEDEAPAPAAAPAVAPAPAAAPSPAPAPAPTPELDLNATPRGFDLNAPVAEEEGLQDGAGWLDEVPAPVAQQEVVVEKLQPLIEPVPAAPDSGVEAGQGAEEAGGGGTVNEDVGLEAPVEQDDVRPSAAVASLLARPVESMAALGIDEDLDILRAAWAALQEANVEALDAVLTDACEELVKSVTSPSKYHLLSCLYVSKKFPESFRLPRTFQVLLSFFGLGKSQPPTKRPLVLPLVACKLLHRAFAADAEWPLDFVEHYLEDATGARAWIEHEGCKEFVTNVLTAFPDASLDGVGPSEDTSKPDSHGTAESAHGPASQPAFRNRYPGDEVRQQVRTKFLSALNQLLTANVAKENPRTLLRLLMQGAGYEEVRVVGSSMLESWLNNTVHVRSAKALLDRIVKHTHATSENDFNTVANLLALRVPSLQVSGQMKAPHGNIFADMVTQLVQRRPEYATLALKTFVTAEMNNRNAHNVKSIATVLKAMPDHPPPEHELALIFQDLAANDESRQQLRDLVRRIMRQAGTDINVHAFCHGLMQPWPAMEEQPEVLKQTWLKQIVDLVCQLLLHAVAVYAADDGLVVAITSPSTPPAAGPGYQSHPSGSSVSSVREKLVLMEKFSIDTANLQEDAMAWCTEVLAVYLPHIQENEFSQIVRQFLFLEGPEVYFINADNAGELDMLSYKLLTSCIRAPEDILARLILMGISTSPMTQAEAVNIIEGLVWRAAKLQNLMDGSLIAKSEQLPAAIFKLASVHLPANSRLQFVLKDIFWRASLVVLIIAVCNPTTIGQFVWLNYPSMRFFMEVLLTGRKSLSFPHGDGVHKFEAEKLETEAVQRDIKAEEAISAFFAAQAATETETPVPWPFKGEEWKGNVMLLNQGGPTRQPPTTVLQQVDHINDMYQLGRMLRKCRSPNFFEHVTSCQTLRQAWPWLEKILISDPDVMTALPCLWQCELLYMHEGSPVTCETHLVDVSGVISNLHKILTADSQLGDSDVKVIVGFLTKKLAARSSLARSCARRCFTLLFAEDVCDPTSEAVCTDGLSDTACGSSSGDTCDWLQSISEVPTKSSLVAALAPSLQLAFQTESSVQVMIAYLNFLQKHSASLPPCTSLTCCVSVLVVQRKLLATCLCSDYEHSQAIPSPSKYNATVEFILETVLTALHGGTAADLGWSLMSASTAPLVTLVSPKSHKDVLRVELHKMVVDAGIQLLSLLSNADGENVWGALYGRYLELLVPGFMDSNSPTSTWTEDCSMAWLEIGGGKRFSLLSEVQAVGFVRSKDIRVSRAGLSALSINTKLDVLEGLSLSVSAGSALLEELDGVSEIRLMAAFQSKGVTSEKSKKIYGSVLLLQKSGSKGGLDFLKKLQKFSSSCVQDDKYVSGDVCVGAKSAEGGNSSEVGTSEVYQGIQDDNVFIEQLISDAKFVFNSQDNFTGGRELPERDACDVRAVSSKYLHFRKGLAKALVHRQNEGIKRCLESIELSMSGIQNKGFLVMSVFPSVLAVLLLLSHRRHVMLSAPIDSGTSPPGQFGVGSSFLAVLSLLRSWNERLGDAHRRDNVGLSSISGRVILILDELEDAASAVTGRRKLTSILSAAGRPFTELQAGLKACSHCTNFPTWLKDGSVHGLETELLAYLSLVISSRSFRGDNRKSEFVQRKCDGCKNGQSRGFSITEELGILVSNWLESPVARRSENPNTFSVQKKQVELAGRIALVVELLLFLRLELPFEDLQGLLGVHISDISMLSHAPSPVNIALEHMLHTSSWTTITSIIVGILKVQGQPCGAEGQSSAVAKATVPCTVLGEAKRFLEFLCGCVQHPRAQIACRFNEDSDLQDIGSILVTCILDPAAVGVLVHMGVVESAAVRLLVQDGRQAVGRDHSWLSRLAQALRLIMLTASEGPPLITEVLANLTNSDSDVQIISLLKLQFRGQESVETAVKESRNHILWALYSTFPISVSGALENSGKSVCTPTMDFTMPPIKHVSPLSRVLRNSLTLLCSNNEKDCNAAYGFLHQFAQQHPALLIPHLRTLTLHLKDLLPLKKQGDVQVRVAMARALSMGIELLDVLRPYILELNKQGQAPNAIRGMGQLESTLSLYFELLQELDTQDRPQFAKVVARFADFLCHSVAAGGQIKEYVLAHHKPVLQATAQTFGKIKKLGYLLTLLENVSSTCSPADLAGQDHVNMGATTGPSFMPVDDVLKVRRQLLHCLRQAPDWKDADLGTHGKDIHRSPRHVHGLYMEEEEDVHLSGVLSDLEKASARMPTVLPILEDPLLELTKVSDSNIRDRAYSLLLRQLLHCPSKETACKIVEGLLAQLTSPEASLAKTAARHVHEFFHCCPDFQETLLVEELKLGRLVADDLQQLMQGLIKVAGES